VILGKTGRLKPNGISNSFGAEESRCGESLQMGPLRSVVSPYKKEAITRYPKGYGCVLRKLRNFPGCQKSIAEQGEKKRSCRASSERLLTKSAKICYVSIEISLKGI